MAGAFINYRTGDGHDKAALLNERLCAVFGKEQVFLDSTGLPAGRLFPPELKRRLRESSVLLVLIGRNWLDVRDANGLRRIDDPDDYVRYEIRKSIKRQKVVLPVLLDGAPLPSPVDLPGDIVDLPSFQYRHLRTREEAKDLEEIVRVLRPHILERGGSSNAAVTTNNSYAPNGAAASGSNASAVYNNHNAPGSRADRFDAGGNE
ncbi:TIR domain-containing protein [Micromonospora citrea]|uniref:TIR domain-containing protein n=1 Tax=Micromonospora citrea TaxID=47855 RepID=A0A1C6U587_9ACTN|nr:TIR domain-containing protein [Micromonospora citrea]SCL49078.1 TIR domain-containing protein [Micromonospora citrea]